MFNQGWLLMVSNPFVRFWTILRMIPSYMNASWATRLISIILLSLIVGAIIWVKMNPERLSVMNTSLGQVIKENHPLVGPIIIIALAFMDGVFSIVYAIPFVNKQRKRFEKESKPFFHFKSWKSVVVMGVIGMLFSLLLTNYITTILRGLINYLYQAVTAIHFSDIFNQQVVQQVNPVFEWSVLLARNLFNFSVFSEAPILSVPIFIGLSIISWRSAWVNFEQFRDYNANESGDDQFAEEPQLKKQYKAVPDKTKKYSGKAGIPVAHIRANNIPGYDLAAKMKWRNKKWGDLLNTLEKKAGLDKLPSGSYLIEDDTINVLITGMTRSGKGEMYVNPTIDLVSRASIPSSMVITDPKGELYQASFKTLRKRGYDVKVLNFQNMDWSLSYNPLALAIDSAKKGYYEKTQDNVKAVAESIYRKGKPSGGNGNEEYWINNSMSLFEGVAMALIDRANEAYQNGEEDAWDTITIRNITNFVTQLGSEEVLVNTEGGEVEADDPTAIRKTKLTQYFDMLRKVNQEPGHYSKFREMADINFRGSDFSTEETKGNIYSSMLADLQLYLQDSVAKLTSKNSVDLKSVGDPRRLSIKFRSSSSTQQKNAYADQASKVTITGLEGRGIRKHNRVIVDHASALTDSEGYLTFVIKQKLPDNFQIKIDFVENGADISQVVGKSYVINCQKKYKKKIGHLQRLTDKFSGEPIINGIDCQIASQPNDGLLEEKNINLVYSEKPIAIFLVTPPNRSEYNSIVSFFINQLFNANYDSALGSDRKTTNRIQFILDEFANIPPIPEMGKKLSIGLGQNIQFMMFVQNLEQIEKNYGATESAEIIGNCSLNSLIKTTSEKTATEYSKLLGTRTITKRTKSTNILNEANPNINTTNPEQPLMTPTQLLKLQAGEVVTIRGVKAQDNSGRKITTDPIFANGRMEMPYRYMFLHDEFDQSMTLSDIPVESAHRGLNLKDIEPGANDTYAKVKEWKLAICKEGEKGIPVEGEDIKLKTRNEAA